MHQVMLGHREYVMAYSILPVLCYHDAPITALRIEDAPMGQRITLPLQLSRAPRRGSTVSSGGSVTVE